jgi:hypothetical protein
MTALEARERLAAASTRDLVKRRVIPAESRLQATQGSTELILVTSWFTGVEVRAWTRE